MAARRKERLGVVFAAIDEISAPVRRINRSIESLTRPISSVVRKMKSLAREAGFTKLGQSVARVGQQLGRLGAIGGAALAGLFYGVKRAAAGADEIGKLAAQVDVSVESLQELQFVSERSGVGVEEFRKGLGMLTKNLGDLKAGSGTLSTLLSKVDPGLQRQLAAATDTEEAFGLLLSAIEKLPTAQQKAALSAAAFGRAGKGLVNVANLGAEGIAALRAEARATGGVLDAETVASAEATQDALLGVSYAVKGLATGILAELFPAVREISAGIQRWIAENHELVRVRAAEFVTELVSGLRQLGGFLQRVIPPTLEVIEALGGLKAVGAVLAVTVLAPLVASIVAVGSALVSTAGLIVAATTAIGVGIAKVVEHWDEIKEKFLGIVETIRNVAGTILHGGLLELLTGRTAASINVTERAVGIGPTEAAIPPSTRERTRAELDGELRIRVDQEGRVRGADLSSRTGGLELEGSAGLVGAPAF